ncbi:TetR/AcrR family transcriptional regulator [Anaerocolumna chitinilytica]|uniref:TetR family transcriptional regulator n=1 Tax=Anaerocolumna chitinilytica TaxID=1727145 RepID=A0A7I8DJ87_9FIRM|nr:TetR/AcrR family transcriptional regulator [Anaerocolumna chitinilytica]BCJ98513.1 TetR family transcriptional regulator [Anaerocolumna chitinilytica]
MKSENLAKPNRSIRKPKQSRSIGMKEKILNSALQLFCEKGYYNTTTNEIAQRAEVSIGSLYSYFKDKDTIFLEILEKYHEKFDMAKNYVLNDFNLLETDSKAWLRLLIENLIKVHEESKELNRELNVLSYYNPKVAEILDEQRRKTLQTTIGHFKQLKDNFKSTDIEAAAIVTFDLISATVDRIVFEKNEIDMERLINATIDVIYKYFSS